MSALPILLPIRALAALTRLLLLPLSRLLAVTAVLLAGLTPFLLTALLLTGLALTLLLTGILPLARILLVLVAAWISALLIVLHSRLLLAAEALLQVETARPRNCSSKLNWLVGKSKRLSRVSAPRAQPTSSWSGLRAHIAPAS